MARIRTLKPDVFLDEELAEVSLEALVLLIGLPCLADREGRLEDRPRRIQTQIFPYRPGINVDACLAELHGARRLVRYEAGGARLLQIVDWSRDQRPHVKERQSIFPPPTQSSTEHQPSTAPAPATSRRLPGDITTQPAGIRDQGSEIGDLRSKSSGPPAARADSLAQAPLVDVPQRAPRTTLAQEFVTWARQASRPKIAPDAPDNCTLQESQWPKLGKALKDHGLLKVQEAFKLFMADAYALERNLPLGLFVGQWEKWVGQVKAPALAAKQSRSPATTTEWTEADLG